MLLPSSPFLFGVGQPLHKVFSLKLIKIVCEITGECSIWMPFELSDHMMSLFHPIREPSRRRSVEENEECLTDKRISELELIIQTWNWTLHNTLMARICPKPPAEYLKKYKGAANTAQADSSSGHLVKKQKKNKSKDTNRLFILNHLNRFLFFLNLFLFFKFRSEWISSPQRNLTPLQWRAVLSWLLQV